MSCLIAITIFILILFIAGFILWKMGFLFPEEEKTGTSDIPVGCKTVRFWL